MGNDPKDRTWLSSEFTSLQLQLDTATGLPTALADEQFPGPVTLRAEVVLTLGGQEVRGALGGLAYDGAQDVSSVVATGPINSQLTRTGRVFTVPVSLGSWRGSVRYTFTAEAPRLTWSWRWSPGDGAHDLRNFTVALSLGVAEPQDWVLNVPGNRLRGDLPLTQLPPAVPVSTIGGLAGSTGLVALSHTREPGTIVLWPRSQDEVGDTLLTPLEDGLAVRHHTQLAAAAAAGTELSQDGIAVDLIDADWPAVRAQVPDWFDDLGIATPTDSPAWTRAATIYEAQVGTSIFAGGQFTYAPYPTMVDLLDDLPRVAGLGFDTLQVMPHQPYPSYNVADYDDIDLSYGSEVDLRRVVDWCHAHGMKVILDVLLHGVLDQESIGIAAQAVRSGPWAGLLDADRETIAALHLSDEEQRDLSWSRHVLDFESAWRSGSPPQHPLCQAHPEWFCTDSAGQIIGIYTKAFDMSNPAWQAYFSDAMVRLVHRLNIDGFRFDAPTYNQFPNWSQRTRSRASLQPLGSVQLFARLRARLHALDPELMMYTEPNGALLRQSMDLNYNYDETWLPAAVLDPHDPRYPGGVRSGKELARWLQDREETLPRGAVTAHHIDSHDTFWWPLPGAKWRREQFGIEAARALMYTFALSGGPYMMFVGGEQDMPDDVARANALRAQRPELARGRHDFGTPELPVDALFTVSHTYSGTSSVLMVNLSADEHQVEASATGFSGDLIDLLLPDEDLCASGTAPLAFAPFQARLLVSRRSAEL